jgi:hypothetical protein
MTELAFYLFRIINAGHFEAPRVFIQLYHGRLSTRKDYRESPSKNMFSINALFGI